MLIRLAELLQYDPQKVAELSCMSGICHVMEQMTLDRVFRCKSRHWTDFASICGLNRLVESGGGFSLLILLIGSTRSATGLRQRLQRLISAESLADPRGKNLPSRGRNKLWVHGVSWLRLYGKILLIIYHYHIVSHCHHHLFILRYVLWQSVIIFSSATSFVVDGFGHFTSASQWFAVDQWTMFCCFCFCFTFRNFPSTMAIFGVL